MTVKERANIYPPDIDLDELQDGTTVGGGYKNNSYTGGAEIEDNDYVPLIAGTAAGLLWWGLGGLLVFLLLLVIYFLGREIYRTQFKSETHYRNIAKHGRGSMGFSGDN